MTLFRPTIRHPFFPELAAVPAARARGQSAAIAGRFGELVWAWMHGARAHRAIYVLGDTSDRLSEGEREELWRLFQVPIYVMVLEEGRVVAWECEAQEGLHAEDGPADCACGRPGAIGVTRKIPGILQAARH